MKLVITSQGPDLNSPVDPRFGRAKFFIVFDSDAKQFSSVDNSLNLNALQGAGIQSGKNIVNLGAEAVITGHVGPKALATLTSAGVKIYTGASGTVAEAVEQFNAGKLKLADSPDVQGHWM
ncbi:NifB/NifX family molybdenum-iron cluster-binding protein [Candidatus Sumerlaeota bacterium]|nr:NifB/NifX family molybdenum-iron cluster-binding protein [Candidatus Sumerlaeota bacterium]